MEPSHCDNNKVEPYCNTTIKLEIAVTCHNFQNGIIVGLFLYKYVQITIPKTCFKKSICFFFIFVIYEDFCQ